MRRNISVAQDTRNERTHASRSKMNASWPYAQIVHSGGPKGQVRSDAQNARARHKNPDDYFNKAPSASGTPPFHQSLLNVSKRRTCIWPCEPCLSTATTRARGVGAIIIFFLPAFNP